MIENTGVKYHLLSLWFLVWLIFDSEDEENMFLPKRHLTFNGLHGVISQKIVLFITTAVKNRKS
jgi:hypothetical protein